MKTELDMSGPFTSGLKKELQKYCLIPDQISWQWQVIYVWTLVSAKLKWMSQYSIQLPYRTSLVERI